MDKLEKDFAELKSAHEDSIDRRLETLEAIVYNQDNTVKQ